ncbi:MAG: PepSY domain-containing protein [Gemmatimonadaceae bacterium]
MRLVSIAKVLTVMLIAGVTTRASAQEAKKSTKAAGVSQSALKNEAKISEVDARKTALAEVPGGKVQSHELEREKGKLIYSYDIKIAGKPGVEEVNVDAVTGALVAHEHEDAKAEAKEKKAEAKAKKP